MKKIGVLLGLGLILALSLSACERLPFDIPWIKTETPSSTQPPDEISETTPTPEMTPTSETEPEPLTSLTIWVPPEMDPLSESEAGQVFADQIQSFSEIHNGLEINVRVKAVSGVGGLLDALTATSAAAPSVLPDLIALPRPDLETAALKELIYAMDGLTEIPDDTDWYGFTRNMALLQGSTFGLPFAVDSLAFVYRPANIPEFPTTWTGLIEANQVLVFAAESDQALFTLALYQAEGGIIQDNQRRPVLEVDPLTEVFRLFQDGVEAGTFPDWLNQYQTAGQAWTAFREGQTDLVLTWVSNYLQEAPADAAVAALYPMSDSAVSIGSGMSWALATPQADRQALAVALAEYLVQPEYLSAWSEAAGYLPPRPSSLEGWQNQSLRSSVSQIALMTRLRPSNDILTSIGPILREGTRQILMDLVDPAQAAQVAVESLEE